MEVAKLEATMGGGVKVDWNIWNIKLRLFVGGPILIVLGLVLYLVRGLEAALVLPVVGIVLLIIGVIYKPHQKTENVASEAQ